MNAKCALIKEFLDGKTVNIRTCFKNVGLTNIGREVPRMIETPFDVLMSRTPREGTSRHGTHITWYDYQLHIFVKNKEGIVIKDNRDGIAKMRAYLAENMGEYRPKTKEPQKAENDLFSELL